jgi:tellurite resistance protein
MVKRYTRSNLRTVDLLTKYFDQRDERVMQALVTAGAFVALADGRADAVERDELLSFIDGQLLIPTIARREIVEAFDNRVRELKDQGSAKVIVETFRSLAGRSPSSFVVRAAERVAAADGYLHPNELEAIGLLRLIITNLPNKETPMSGRSRLCRGVRDER